MSGKDKWVRRFSVDETARHKNGFTIYKITSVLFPLSSPSAGTIVSVWKRFSDVQRLHRGMRALHTGLTLPGDCPRLPQRSFFRRFDAEVLEERCRAIKELLEFIAEHRLLFASTEFVNFLQTGYPEPEGRAPGVINEIRSALHLPIEDTPPLEYQTDDDEIRSPGRAETTRDATDGATAAITDGVTNTNTDGVTNTNTDGATNTNTIDVSDIPIFEAADVELPTSPKTEPNTEPKDTDSYESLDSLDSIESDLFDEVSRMTIDKPRPCVKRRAVLPDLINFDAPSTSRSEDGNTARVNTDAESLDSTSYDGSESRRSASRVSLSSRASTTPVPASTSDSYIFEAGYLLQQGARCEVMEDYAGAFQRYKSGIEKMLIGVQSDGEPARRALIKQKTNKYLSHAEALYNQHLANADQYLAPPLPRVSLLAPLPARLLQRDYEELGLYRLLAVLAGTLMLVLHTRDQTRHVIKVIQKIPNNLTEFDEIFHQRPHETKQPILPTNIPYMVSLNSYIETPNLIFLILDYAPGEKLFDYIRNYVKSIPNTPARELNLENVFVEPQKGKSKDVENRNDSLSVDLLESSNSIRERGTDVGSNKNNNGDDKKTDSEISVQELVSNSQKLLQNVSKVLNAEPKYLEIKEEDNNEKNKDLKEHVQIEVVDKDAETNVRQNIDLRKTAETPLHLRLTPRARDALPPSAICKWAAQILTGLESLHNSGVVWRDLKPSNILLGRRGQVILTYCTGYSPGDTPPLPPAHHTAPELGELGEPGEVGEMCDFWSFGAILYELICGVPLSYYHRGAFTAHTLLHLPPSLHVEAASILTQLLTHSPRERLGAGGVHEVKAHPYFKHIDWQDVYDSWLSPD